eukprot:PhF_6_TR42159/c1_g1_i2/m.63717
MGSCCLKPTTTLVSINQNQQPITKDSINQSPFSPPAPLHHIHQQEQSEEVFTASIGCSESGTTTITSSSFTFWKPDPSAVCSRATNNNDDGTYCRSFTSSDGECAPQDVIPYIAVTPPSPPPKSMTNKLFVSKDGTNDSSSYDDTKTQGWVSGNMMFECMEDDAVSSGVTD